MQQETQTQTQSDSELMVELRQGRDGALSDLIARWQGPLLAFGHRYTQSETASAELVEETFARIFQLRRYYRRQFDFSVWIFTIMVNLCLGKEGMTNRYETGLRSPENNGDPAGEDAGEEMVKAMKEAVGELPHDLRTVLLLSQYHGMTFEGIGAVLGKSPKAVKGCLCRARSQLVRDLRL